MIGLLFHMAAVNNCIKSDRTQRPARQRYFRIYQYYIFFIKSSTALAANFFLSASDICAPLSVIRLANQHEENRK